jgi:hypothetical protein
MLKKELEELIEQKEQELKDLRKKKERWAIYEMYDEGAAQMKALYDSFLTNGFTREQAFELLKESIRGSALIAKG